LHSSGLTFRSTKAQAISLSLASVRSVRSTTTCSLTSPIWSHMGQADAPSAEAAMPLVGVAGVTIMFAAAATPPMLLDGPHSAKLGGLELLIADYLAMLRGNSTTVGPGVTPGLRPRTLQDHNIQLTGSTEWFSARQTSRNGNPIANFSRPTIRLATYSQCTRQRSPLRSLKRCMRN